MLPLRAAPPCLAAGTADRPLARVPRSMLDHRMSEARRLSASLAIDITRCVARCPLRKRLLRDRLRPQCRGVPPGDACARCCRRYSSLPPPACEHAERRARWLLAGSVAGSVAGTVVDGVRGVAPRGGRTRVSAVGGGYSGEWLRSALTSLRSRSPKIRAGRTRHDALLCCVSCRAAERVQQLDSPGPRILGMILG